MVNQAARHGWTARQNSVGEWMQIDLGADMDVRGVLLQGKPTTPVGCYALPDDYTLYYVSSLKIQTATSDDPSNFVWRDGASYRGCQTKTSMGYTCQSWFSQTPHPHSTP